MKLRASPARRNGHPVVEVLATVDRAREGRVLARVHCLSNEARVDYDDTHAKNIDGPTFNELTRSIRSAMGQVKDMLCVTCGRFPR